MKRLHEPVARRAALAERLHAARAGYAEISPLAYTSARRSAVERAMEAFILAHGLRVTHA